MKDVELLSKKYVWTEQFIKNVSNENVYRSRCRKVPKTWKTTKTGWPVVSDALRKKTEKSGSRTLRFSDYSSALKV